MNLLIDIDSLAPPLTGVGYYTHNLIENFKQSNDISNLKFISSGRIVDSEHSNPNTPVNGARKVARKLPFKTLLRKGYRHYRSINFFLQTRDMSDYIYHDPNYSLLPYRGNSVVTIHDLSFLRHPEFHPSDRVKFWSRQVRDVSKRATHIITVSEYQKSEIMDLLGVEQERVTAIHSGVSKNFRDYSHDECAATLAKHGLNYKQFCLVVATVEPRKNFNRIFEAFSQLPKSVREAYPLVIVGDKGWLSDDIHNRIADLVNKNQAHSLGYVTEQDLYHLYASATLFLYPSIYEGFGLPVLEAMASGTAVLSSNTTSIPEVAGSSCYLVDPLSVEEIANGWNELLSDENMRNEYAYLGKERAKTMTWEKCASKTIDVYKKLSQM